MANNSVEIISSTYAGELALPYIAPAILAGDSITNGYITVKENVKMQAVLKKLSGTDIQAYACDFSVTDDAIDLAEVLLTPTKLMFPLELCKADYRDDWEAMATGRGFANGVVPPNFQTFLLQYAAARNAEAIEKNIWHGNYNSTDGTTSGGGAVTNFAGIMARAVTGSANLGYDGEVGGAFTADANGTTGILTHIDSLIGNAPDAIAGDINTVIYMSRKSLFLLQRAMAGFQVQADATGSSTIAPQFIGAAKPDAVLGYNIVVPAGFPNDTLMLAQTQNLYFGTDLVSDFASATVVDMTPTTGDDLVRVRYNYTGGCQIGFLGDVGVVRRTS